MKKIEKYFFRNAASISAGEFLWGMGIPVLLESTFLQIFLSNAGASNKVIGLTGSIYFVSISVMPIFAAWLSEKLVRKKTLVVMLHIVPSLAVLFLGLFYAVFGEKYDVVKVFLLFYTLFSASLGLVLPVWNNYIVKIFSGRQRLKGLSIMMIFQNAAKLISGVTIALLISLLGFTISTVALLFFLTGLFFLIGSFGYAFVHEEPEENVQTGLRHPLHFVVHYSKHIMKNRSMKLFMLHDFEFYSVITVMAFYARYASDELHFSKAETGGVFAAIAFSGAVVSTILFGFIWKIHLKRKMYAAKAVSAAGVLLLAAVDFKTVFYAASFLLGFSRGARSLFYAPAVKKLSGLSDASPYFAIVPLLMLPVSGGMPIAAGGLIDALSGMGSGLPYRICFLVTSAVIGFSIFFLRKIDSFEDLK